LAGAIFNSAQYLSLAVFTPLMAALAHYAGWRHIFTVMGALGIVLAAVWFLAYFAPDKHPRLSRENWRIWWRAARWRRPAPNRAWPPRRRAILGNRMLLGVFFAQYCVASLSTFFISWFPTYLVQGRHFTMLDAGFVAAIPAVCGCIGGVSAGVFSDWLLRRHASLSLARKLPITLGLVLSSTIMLCALVSSNALVIAIMSAAFFGKGFGALGWTVVADTAPREAIGLTGGVFNAAGSVGGIITPIAIGTIVEKTGSFDGALLYVGLHVLAAVAAYWLIVGPIRRFETSELDKTIFRRPCIDRFAAECRPVPCVCLTAIHTRTIDKIGGAHVNQDVSRLR
jgi:ACS family glucarate transporter-like MFS transporter